MGKHVNADAESDEGDAEIDHHEVARHVADPGHPLEPQAVISVDTNVGAGVSKRKKGTRDAAASPAHPDELIKHGLVGDGHELE